MVAISDFSLTLLLIAQKFCADVKIVAKQSETATTNANANRCRLLCHEVDSSAEFFEMMRPFMEILHGEP